MSEKEPIGLRQTNRKSRVDKHPFHLASEFGCYHVRKLENPDLDLNFVKHGENIETKHTTSAFFNPKTWIYYSTITGARFVKNS